MRDNFWPALVRQYGEIAGPYVIQTDGCASINGGVHRFNEYIQPPQPTPFSQY